MLNKTLSNGLKTKIEAWWWMKIDIIFWTFNINFRRIVNDINKNIKRGLLKAEYYKNNREINQRQLNTLNITWRSIY